MKNQKYQEGGGIDPFSSSYALQPAATQPTMIDIQDQRKLNPVTKKPLTDKQKKSVKVNQEYITSIIGQAKAAGIDPYTALAVSYQESGFGNGDKLFNLNPKVFGKPFGNAEEGMKSLQDMFKYAKNLQTRGVVPQGEEYYLQGNNGYGKIKRGHADLEGSTSIYGVPIPNEGIDFKQNPYYGQTVMSLRDEVLKKNSTINNLIQNTPAVMRKPIRKYAEGGEIETLDSTLTGGGGTPKPSTIPLPDYKDPKSRLAYAQAFRDKYGKDTLKGYGDIPLRVNEKPMYGSKTSKELAIQEAKAVGLDPALFYSSAMIEGQSGLYSGATKTDKGEPAWKGNTGDKDFPISGLWGFGLDSFTDYYPSLVKKGYLPKDFDKQFKVWEGEGGPLGADADPESAMFRSTDAGIKAKAAMMRAFYDESDAYAKKKGYTLTPEQRDFFGLAHFNSGTHGYQMMDAYSKAGLLKNNDFLNKMPNIPIAGVSPKLHQQIYGNISPRLAAARGLKEEGLFAYGGKIPKYQDGTEDPIKPANFLNPNNVGVNTWSQPGSDIPINPNAPSQEQIFRLPQQGGTTVEQGNIIPLAQFANQSYVNNQGQTTADVSANSKMQADKFSRVQNNIEEASTLGITAINAYFNKQDAARRDRTDRRQAIMQQQFSPVFNPYAEGTGSQAIMKYGGGLSRGDDYGSKSKPYPSVSSSDFAGGGRSYPIPTRADAEDALRLAHLHGRSDVIAKVHAKYPDLKYGGAIMNMSEYSSGGTIHIKPENRGKFNATKKRTGKSTEELTHSSNPTTRKRAIFAQNAAKWHHGENGLNIPLDEATQDMQIIDGGNAKVVSTSDHSNPMIEFSGKEHTGGGIGLQYGGSIAEVEDKEVGWVDQEGGLNIFGKLKLPGTNQTFRKTAKDMADQESKIDGQKSKYLNILNNGSTTDPYQESAQSTAKVMFKSLDKQSKQIAEKKEALASYQNLILAMTEQNSTHMKYGGKLPKKPYEDGGEVEGPEDPINIIPLKKDFNKAGRDLKNIKGIVLHKTAGTSSAKDVVSGWDSDNRNASADYIIDKDGTITQVGDLGDTKWHSGKKNINKTTLGVEIVGASKDESDMTPAQYKALQRLHTEVFAPMGITPNNYYGHTQVNRRKGFDFADPKSIQNVLSKSGISTSYTPDKALLDPNYSGQPSALAAAEDAQQITPITGSISSNQEYPGIAGGSGSSAIETPYGKARREPSPFSGKANIGNGNRERGFISPLAMEQIAPELLTIATNRREPVNQLSYQPDLKQTFDVSYQQGRNENQSTFNQAAKIAESTGNIDALSQLAAQKYQADQAYNMQEVQGNAQQKLQTYNQNVDVSNDAKVKNLALIADQQVKQAQAKFNTRAEDLSAIKSISGKSLQNQLENKTYNAYANLFKHYGFDKKGNITFDPDQITQRFTAGEAQQFGMMAAQQGAQAIANGDFSRQFTKVKNSDGSQTTTETLGTNKKIQEEYKALKNQGFDDGIIGNMLRAKYPETITRD